MSKGSHLLTDKDVTYKDSLLSASTLWIAINFLKEDYECSKFEKYLKIQEFSILCEAAVLFDRILLLVGPDDFRHLSNEAMLSDLTKNHILEFVDIVESIENGVFDQLFHKYELNEKFKDVIAYSLIAEFARWRHAALSFLQKDPKEALSKSLEERYIRTSVYEEFAQKTSTTFYAGVLDLPFLNKESKPANIKVYKIVSEKIREIVEELKDSDFFIPIFIPPITSVLLSRVQSKREIIRELLNLREEFEDFRRKYSEFQNLIANPNSLTLKEMLQARKEYITDLEIVLSRLITKKSDHDTAIINEKYDIGFGGINQIAIGENITQIIYGIPSNLLSDLSSKNFDIKTIKGNARVLFDLFDKVLNIRAFNRLFEKIFKLNFSTEDIAQIDEYANLIENHIKPQRNTNFYENKGHA